MDLATNHLVIITTPTAQETTRRPTEVTTTTPTPTGVPTTKTLTEVAITTPATITTLMEVRIPMVEATIHRLTGTTIPAPDLGSESRTNMARITNLQTTADTSPRQETITTTTTTPTEATTRILETVTEARTRLLGTTIPTALTITPTRTIKAVVIGLTKALISPHRRLVTTWYFASAFPSYSNSRYNRTRIPRTRLAMVCAKASASSAVDLAVRSVRYFFCTSHSRICRLTRYAFCVRRTL